MRNRRTVLARALEHVIRDGSRRTVLVLAAVVSSGVAGAQRPPDAALVRLERAQAAAPAALGPNRALGIWFYRHSRVAEARVALSRARAANARDATSVLYAGLAAEADGDRGSAIDAYRGYLATSRDARVERQVRGRLLALTVLSARDSARAALATGTSLGSQGSSAWTIAVLPFRVSSADVTLHALGRGMAELVTTDLAKARQLTVVERDRMQAIADELALAAAGTVDSASAARSGRLLAAGRIVQGAVVVDGTANVSMSSPVFDVETAAQIGRGQAQQGALDELFDLEKRLVFGVLDDLGVVLTPRERREMDRRPTRQLDAFLAFSRGLEAQDQNRLDDAARLFEQAHGLDPSFRAAAERAQGVGASRQSIESAARTGRESGAIIAAADRGLAGTDRLSATLSAVTSGTTPTTTDIAAAGAAAIGAVTRDAVAEKTGGDQPVPRVGHVTIIVRRP